MASAKERQLIRAAAVGLIVFAAIAVPASVVAMIFNIANPVLGFEWALLLIALTWFLESSAALAAGLILLYRPQQVVLAATVWLVGAALNMGYYIFQARNLDLTWENLSYVCSVFAPVFGLVAAWVVLFRSRKATNEDPGCSQCGYVLKGLREPRCPECGRVYTLDEFYNL